MREKERERERERGERERERVVIEKQMEFVVAMATRRYPITVSAS